VPSRAPDHAADRPLCPLPTVKPRKNFGLRGAPHSNVFE
jgi:hypothetical protein